MYLLQGHNFPTFSPIFWAKSFCRDIVKNFKKNFPLIKELLSLTHLDAEQHCDKKDRNREEQEEHEEPGTPMEPVTETHHPHVLLKHTTQGRGHQYSPRQLNPQTQTPASTPSASSLSPEPQLARCLEPCR